MADKIKIDIVSDVVCPWCTIGYKRLEKAITDLNKVVGINPKDDEAYHNLSICFKSLKKYEKAIESSNNAIDLNPNADL